MSLPLSLFAQMTDAKIIGLEEAKRIDSSAQARAEKDNWNVAIAIVDAGGHLIYFQRMNGTQLASIEIAVSKAKTSAYYKRPTKSFEERVTQGAVALIVNPEMLAFEGGLPIIYEGNIIGAIGVSGVTAQKDGIIAQAGLEGL